MGFFIVDVAPFRARHEKYRLRTYHSTSIIENARKNCKCFSKQGSTCENQQVFSETKKCSQKLQMFFEMRKHLQKSASISRNEKYLCLDRRQKKLDSVFI
jgi:hypothetical protein